MLDFNSKLLQKQRKLTEFVQDELVIAKEKLYSTQAIQKEKDKADFIIDSLNSKLCGAVPFLPTAIRNYFDRTQAEINLISVTLANNTVEFFKSRNSELAVFKVKLLFKKPSISLSSHIVDIELPNNISDFKLADKLVTLFELWHFRKEVIFDQVDTNQQLSLHLAEFLTENNENTIIQGNKITVGIDSMEQLFIKITEVNFDTDMILDTETLDLLPVNENANHSINSILKQKMKPVDGLAIAMTDEERIRQLKSDIVKQLYPIIIRLTTKYNIINGYCGFFVNNLYVTNKKDDNFSIDIHFNMLTTLDSSISFPSIEKIVTVDFNLYKRVNSRVKLNSISVEFRPSFKKYYDSLGTISTDSIVNLNTDYEKKLVIKEDSIKGTGLSTIYYFTKYVLMTKIDFYLDN